MQADGSKRTFNSVNATLAAMAGKGYVTKAKAVFEAEAKILTKYTKIFLKKTHILYILPININTIFNYMG